VAWQTSAHVAAFEFCAFVKTADNVRISSSVPFNLSYGTLETEEKLASGRLAILVAEVAALPRLLFFKPKMVADPSS